MKKDVLIEVENTQTLGGRDEKYTVSVNGTLETEYTIEFAPDSRALNSMKITVSEGKIEDV